MKQIILFNSYVFTVKSVYRKKLRKRTIRFYLHVLEEDKKFIFDIKDINEYNFLKRGAVITIHVGNGGYICIEEGNKLPEDDRMYCAEIEHIDKRIYIRKKNNK